MDLVPLHPKLVHLPIALAVLMPLVSAGLLAAWWRGLLPRRTWAVAVVLQVLLVGSGVAALRSGEADEERVEEVVAEGPIKAHEEAAEAFLWGAAVVLLAMLAAAAVPNERAARALAAAAAAGTLVVLFLGYRTGEAGGRLVYQHGAASVFAESAGAPAPRGDAGAEPDDDD